MAGQPVDYMARTRRYYEAQGFEKPYVWAQFDDVPFSVLDKPLSEATLTLITTSALHRRTTTDAREVASGSSIDPPDQLYADDLSWARNETHLDDRGSYFPIDDLKALVADGRIGALADRFHCAPTEYSHRRTLESDAPEILERCRADATDIALLVPL